MKGQNYHTVITVNATAQESFKCINNVTKWWTENFKGRSHELNDDFTVQFEDIHKSTQKLLELIPNQKVVWLVTESKLNFIEDKDEWTNTKIVFEIIPQGNQTQIHFTHIGLVPNAECYGNCVKAWDHYIKSLFKLITEGKGTPETKTSDTLQP